MVFLIILVVSLIYFIKINSNETDELTDNLVLNEIENVNKNKDVKDPELNEIATALKNIKPIDFTPYEKEEEEKAIISYDELMKVKDKIYNITDDEETDEFIDELKNFRLDL